MNYLKIIAFVLVTCTIAACDKNKTETDASTFDGAFLLYYGDYYGSGAGNFDLLLYSGNEDDDDFAEIYLECMSDYFDDAMQAKMTPGTYTFSNSYNKFTFTGDSELYINDEEMPITGGSFTLARNGKQYTISCNFTLENGDSFKGSYRGAIAYEYDSNLTSNLTLNTFEAGECAELQDGAWMIFLPVNEDEIIVLSINTDSGLSSIPTGEFPIAATARQWVSGTADPCSLYEESAYGCWYTNYDDGTQSFAVGGSGRVTISGASPEYVVDFSFKDANGYSVSGNYTGDLPVTNLPEELAISAKSLKTIDSVRPKR